MMPCAIEECERSVVARGLCGKHYQRWRMHRDPRRKVRNDRGEGTVSADGYRVVRGTGHPNAHRSNGAILEHRLVMATVLDRPLRDDEYVHHKNGDKLDNRPENLELWVRAQPSGQRVEDLVAWAREILGRYGGS